MLSDQCCDRRTQFVKIMRRRWWRRRRKCVRRKTHYVWNLCGTEIDPTPNEERKMKRTEEKDIWKWHKSSRNRKFSYDRNKNENFWRSAKERMTNTLSWMHLAQVEQWRNSLILSSFGCSSASAPPQFEEFCLSEIRLTFGCTFLRLPTNNLWESVKICR